MNEANRVLVARVKGALHPPTTIEAYLEKLLECLPRVLIPLSYDHLPEVVRLDGNFAYQSDSADPKIRLIFPEEEIISGWYYLEGSLIRNNGNREAYILGTRSATVTFKHPVPTNLRGSVREVFHIPPSTTSIFLQPTSAPGYFSHGELLLHRITGAESLIRRLYSVLSNMKDAQRLLFRRPNSHQSTNTFNRLYARLAEARMRRFTAPSYDTYLQSIKQQRRTFRLPSPNNIKPPKTCPTFSLIVIVADPTPSILLEMIRTVFKQIYPYWELLLLTDHASFNTIPPDFLADNRVRTFCIPSTASRALLLNTGIAEARGLHITELGQNDRLSADALTNFAHCLIENPNYTIIYSDHDHIDSTGKRTTPFFKPAWNPDLFTSYNYIDRPFILPRFLIMTLGGYREEFDGAETYDLLLRATRSGAKQQILHIPKILCSKYITIVNNSPSPNGLPCFEASRLALVDFLSQSNVTVEQGLNPGLCHISYPIPTVPPLVTVIIPTRDKVHLLKKCIESILAKTIYPNYELIIIDNKSVVPETFEYFEQLESDKRIHVIKYSNPFNYSTINNIGAAYAQGEILVFLNNDVEVITPAWLSELVANVLRPEIGVVGAKLLYSSNLVQHAGIILGVGGVAGHWHRFIRSGDPGYCYRAIATQNLTAVTGACMAIRGQLFSTVNGFDPVFAIALNDVDLCLRVQSKGYRNLFLPNVLLYHHESATRGPDDTPAKRLVFQAEKEEFLARWGNTVKCDPAYHPNLTVLDESVSLATTPRHLSSACR